MKVWSLYHGCRLDFFKRLMYLGGLVVFTMRQQHIHLGGHHKVLS